MHCVRDRVTGLQPTGREMYKRAAALLCGLICVPAPASPPHVDPAVVARGEHLARIICAQCHVVADDQRAPLQLRESTPSFREIANRPGTSPKSLRHFIAKTHWDMQTLPMTMPNPELTHEQVRAVTQYILSLRKR